MEDKEFMENEENIGIVELIDENGETVQFEHLDTLELDGTTYALHNGKWYSFNDYYLERVNKRIMEIITRIIHIK